MSTAQHVARHYTAEFEVTAENGIIRLPAEYADLANARLRVLVWPDAGPAAAPADGPRAARRAELLAAFDELARLNPYRAIDDAAAWQRDQRHDRPLPGRA